MTIQHTTWRITFLCIGFLLPLSISAQQVPQFTQFMFNEYAFNPAYAGAEGDVRFQGNMRTQWLGVTAAPLTFNVGAHMPIPLLNSGWGINANYDVLGAETHSSIELSYAYYLSLRQGRLGIGLRGGLAQRGMNGEELISPTGIYEGGTIDHNDALIPVDIQSNYAPNFGFGLSYTNKKLTLGFALTHLLEPKVSFETEVGTIEQQYKRHFLINGSYELELNNSFTLTPSFLLKSDFNRYQSDIGVIISYEERFHIGSSFRGYETSSFEALSIIGGVQANNWLISYSYDIGLFGIASFANGSHEIAFQYTLQNILPSKTGKAIFNMRYR